MVGRISLPKSRLNLSKRLAATLGSKSSFKKLPRRSVLTADISQLCDLIAEPKEPLALRLSSNLMVGVARCVCKQECHPLALIMVELRQCISRYVPPQWLSVYRLMWIPTVKHEIFLVDVTACFNSLRKTFQDLALTNNEAALQMNQPTLRLAARTVHLCLT